MCEAGSNRKEKEGKEKKVDISPSWIMVLEFGKLVHKEIMSLESDREIALETIRMITALVIH